MTTEFQKELKEVYGDTEKKRDVFGRRPATPAEIERAIINEPKNIRVKEESKRRRRHVRKGR